MEAAFFCLMTRPVRHQQWLRLPVEVQVDPSPALLANRIRHGIRFRGLCMYLWFRVCMQCAPCSEARLHAMADGAAAALMCLSASQTFLTVISCPDLKASAACCTACLLPSSHSLQSAIRSFGVVSYHAQCRIVLKRLFPCKAARLEDNHCTSPVIGFLHAEGRLPVQVLHEEALDRRCVALTGSPNACCLATAHPMPGSSSGSSLCLHAVGLLSSAATAPEDDILAVDQEEPHMDELTNSLADRCGTWEAPAWLETRD